jgi:hypothetical protein
LNSRPITTQAGCEAATIPRGFIVMIQFPCKCGFRFEVPSDQAGGLVQCPECGLLADVPSMNDVASLHPDGTFAFGSDTHVVDTMTVADRQRIFTNKTLDE